MMQSNKQQNYQVPNHHHVENFFSSYSFSTKSLISKEKLSRILNTQCRKVFNRNLHQPIIDQIWEQAQTTSKGQATITTMIEIILEAIDILGKRITEIKGTDEGGIDGLLMQKRLQLDDKKKELEEHEEYYADNPKKINALRKELIQMQFQQNELENDLSMFEDEHRLLCGLCIGKKQLAEEEKRSEISPNLFGSKSLKYNPYTSTYYHKKVQQKQSKAFLTIFHLTNVLFFLQFFSSTYRLPMLTLLMYLHSYFIVFVGFENSTSIKLILGQGILSIILDAVFLVLKITNKVYLMPFIHQTNYTFSVVCYIILGASLVVRVFLLMLYSRYLNEENLKTRDYFNLLGNRFYLNHGPWYQKQNSLQESRMLQNRQ